MQSIAIRTVISVASGPSIAPRRTKGTVDHKFTECAAARRLEPQAAPFELRLPRDPFPLLARAMPAVAMGGKGQSRSRLPAELLLGFGRHNFLAAIKPVRTHM